MLPGENRPNYAKAGAVSVRESSFRNFGLQFPCHHPVIADGASSLPCKPGGLWCSHHLDSNVSKSQLNKVQTETLARNSLKRPTKIANVFFTLSLYKCCSCLRIQGRWYKIRLPPKQTSLLPAAKKRGNRKRSGAYLSVHWRDGKGSGLVIGQL